MARTVRDPEGTTWVVRRRWIPRLGRETLWGRFRRRYRAAFRRSKDLGDVSDVGCVGDLGETILVGLAIVAVVLFMVFVGFPLLFALFDLLVLIVLALAGGAARVLFRRPWTVEAAAAGDDRVHVRRVVGWQASGRRCDAMAEHLEAGLEPPPDDT